VIFTDEVIWYCVDCEEEVIDTNYPDHDTSNSSDSKNEVDSSDEECVRLMFIHNLLLIQSGGKKFVFL